MAQQPLDELVVVVPSDRLRTARLAQGFDPRPDPILAAIFTPDAARVMPRSAAEADPRFKQIVGYVVLRCGRMIFHYQRTHRVGEPRLAGQRSLGIGGHLNAEDVGSIPGLDDLERAIHRELAEEVVLAERPAMRYLGMINDDSTEVGRVHVGLVALADLRVPAVQLRDRTLQDGRFDPPEAIQRILASFETWSQLTFPALVNLLETS